MLVKLNAETKLAEHYTDASKCYLYLWCPVLSLFSITLPASLYSFLSRLCSESRQRSLHIHEAPDQEQPGKQRQQLPLQLQGSWWTFSLTALLLNRERSLLKASCWRGLHFSPCLRGVTLGAPVSSHSPNMPGKLVWLVWIDIEFLFG